MKSIAGTLKHGDFDGANHRFLLVSVILLGVFCVAVSCIGLVMVIISYNALELSLSDVLLSSGGFCITGILLPGVFWWLYRNNEKCRKEIEVWLTDAVELQAYARQIGARKDDLGIIDHATGFGRCKIRVEFKYDGVYHAYESRGGGSRMHPEDEGFQRVWRKYANKKIDILFSPKYEEVMILKFNRRKEKVDTSKETAKIDSPPSDKDTPQA